jgi:hypothetical protein
MQGRSAEFDKTVSKPHTSVSRVDVVKDGKVVDQLPVHAGSVTADRTAAQMRSFQVEVSDPDGTLTPEGMTSEIAPFGTRIQLWRGARIASGEVQAVFYGTSTSWLPNSTGVLVSILVDQSDGAITLGPAVNADLFPSPTLYPSPTLFPY